MINELKSESYVHLIQALKQEISNARIRAHLAVNREMIHLYWNIGRKILERQNEEGWGTKVIENISNDLRKEFPEMKGLSSQNLKYMKKFADTYDADSISQQAVDRIPWGHIVKLIYDIKSDKERNWYIQKTIENGWSRNVLSLQMQTNLYARDGKSINNFSSTLPAAQSDLASAIIKDPYNLEFLDIQGKILERDLENKLIDNIRKFLLELGQGFAFIGNQYHIELEGEDYYIDMVMYHVKLKCYVIIELKIGKFKPEYAGKMNFYLNLMDRQVKDKSDNPTIGIILCEDKKKITVEYAIEGINKPIGVSHFKLTEKLPRNLENYLPTPEVLNQINTGEEE
jgi:predicted nuclease of restriction endonuclease-like (RecB) superfamily